MGVWMPNDSYDLILRGGEVLDPANGSRRRADVGVLRGRIARIGDLEPGASAPITLDVSGLLVTPGLIDLHVHVFEGGTGLGVSADQTSGPSGVTTVVDAGSAGAHNFGAFRRLVVNTQRTRVLAFVHIATTGLTGFPVGELTNPALADVDKAARVVEENADVCLGIKIRLAENAVGGRAVELLQRALEAARGSASTLMVHISDCPVPLREVLALLHAGDIITHCFTGRAAGLMVDPSGRLDPACLVARERGVRFDVAHGAGSFSVRVARAALASGFPPDVISTDLHGVNINGPVWDLPAIMSKFVALGMSVDEVVRRSTLEAARAIGPEAERQGLGALRKGGPADIAVLRLDHGDFDWTDTEGEHFRGSARLSAVHTIRAGRLWGRPYRYPDW
jgi:dihydroorotase